MPTFASAYFAAAPLAGRATPHSLAAGIPSNGTGDAGLGKCFRRCCNPATEQLPWAAHTPTAALGSQPGPPSSTAALLRGMRSRQLQQEMPALASASLAAAILWGNTFPLLQLSGCFSQWSSYRTHTMACTSGKKGWEYTAAAQHASEVRNVSIWSIHTRARWRARWGTRGGSTLQQSSKQGTHASSAHDACKVTATHTELPLHAHHGVHIMKEGVGVHCTTARAASRGSKPSQIPAHLHTEHFSMTRNTCSCSRLLLSPSSRVLSTPNIKPAANATTHRAPTRLDTAPAFTPKPPDPSPHLQSSQTAPRSGCAPTQSSSA